MLKEDHLMHAKSMQLQGLLQVSGPTALCMVVRMNRFRKGLMALGLL